MFVILYEKTSELAFSKKQDIIDRFHKKSVVYINSKKEIKDLETYKKPPFFNDGWLFVCSGKLDASLLEKLNKLESNLILICVKTEEKLHDVLTILSPITKDVKVIDNHVISNKDMILFIQNELHVDYSLAKKVLSMSGEYPPLVVRNVHNLGLLPEVTLETIKEYTISSSSTPIYELVDYLLLRKNVKAKDAIKIIYDYRYGYSHLVKYLTSTLGKYITVFDLVTSGELSLENYKEYQLSTKNEAIRKINTYQLQKIIESYQSVSIDWLYYVYYFVTTNAQKKESMYKLIEFCAALGGN